MKVFYVFIIQYYEILSTWFIVSVTEKLNFLIECIVIHLSFNSHMWLMATFLNPTALNDQIRGNKVFQVTMIGIKPQFKLKETNNSLSNC